jgi:hypothetical protein
MRQKNSTQPNQNANEQVSDLQGANHLQAWLESLPDKFKRGKVTFHYPPKEEMPPPSQEQQPEGNASPMTAKESLRAGLKHPDPKTRQMCAAIISLIEKEAEQARRAAAPMN